MVRIGAFLLLVSPLLPQVEAGGRAFSPLLLVGELGALSSDVAQLGITAWLFLPLAAGTMLLAGSWRPAAPGPAVRAFTLVLLLAVSFALATLGSILLTETGAGPQAPTASFPVSLMLFLTPLFLGGVSLARLVGGEFDRSSGGFARLSIGLLLALNGFFLMDSGWELLLSWVKQNGIPHAQAGAWPGPAGGLMVAAGEALSRFRMRAAVDTAPASG
jgi:hypothetical protein